MLVAVILLTVSTVLSAVNAVLYRTILIERREAIRNMDADLHQVAEKLGVTLPDHPR